MHFPLLVAAVSVSISSLFAAEAPINVKVVVISMF